VQRQTATRSAAIARQRGGALNAPGHPPARRACWLAPLLWLRRDAFAVQRLYQASGANSEPQTGCTGGGGLKRDDLDASDLDQAQLECAFHNATGTQRLVRGCVQRWRGPDVSSQLSCKLMPCRPPFRSQGLLLRELHTSTVRTTLQSMRAAQCYDCEGHQHTCTAARSLAAAGLKSQLNAWRDVWNAYGRCTSAGDAITYLALGLDLDQAYPLVRPGWCAFG